VSKGPLPDLVVSLRGGYGHTQIERAIRDLDPLFRVGEPVVLRVDLSGLAFIGPTVIALLEAAMRRVEDSEWVLPGTVIVVPKSPLTSMYLHRMNLYRGMKTVGALEETFTRKEPVGFRPCQEFDNEDAVPTVAREMSAALAERVGTDELAQRAVYVCMSELTENVIHHADAPAGYAAAQGNPKRKHFEVAVVDLGQGIRASLSKNPKYADIGSDVEAIETALQPRVTATPERNSGIGLFITALLLHENDGSLLVRSGYGHVVGGVGEGAKEMPVSLPGTMVTMRARTDRPLDISEIYRRLPNGRSNDDKLDA
jgi:anti-sigma regulatory factor (Ser/Thr protein kinase)